MLSFSIKKFKPTIIVLSLLYIVLWCDSQQNSERELPDFSHHKIPSPPHWARAGILYEVFPRVFSKEGTFAAIQSRLNHIQDLGVNIIWLMPIHPVGEKGRKGNLGSPYAVQDFRKINPDYGNIGDLKNLVDEVHRRGMKIILDMVPNHAALDNSLIQSYPEWFMRDESGQFIRKEKEWSDTVDFNYSNPEMRKYMLETLVYWIREFDIDGYRCDVAGCVPYEFWQEALQVLRQEKPDIYLLAEWEDPEILLNGFHSDYGWTEYHTLVDIRKGVLRTAEVVNIIQEIEEKYPQNHLRLRFLENHDEQRSMSLFGAQAIEAYATLLFTLPGLPLIYAGQEIGELETPSLFEKSHIQWEQADPSLLNMYKNLINLRKSNSCFTRGNFRLLPVASLNGSVGAFCRWDDVSAALVVSNLRSKAAEKVLISLSDEQRSLLEKYRWSAYGSVGETVDVQTLYFESIQAFQTRIYLGEI
ncbi:MAG: alpha-galactosidase [Calditrichia bacterium]|nr:alpha-galactosidase [Calditrichia bacterium]